MDKELIQLQNLMEAYARQRWRNSLPQVLQGIRSVYGGFLGEKLSQDSPKDVWEALARIGVSQIIDLRYHYDSEKFRTRCKEYGISYYNYPIHNDAETIEVWLRTIHDSPSCCVMGISICKGGIHRVLHYAYTGHYQSVPDYTPTTCEGRLSMTSGR
jgi:hypothetical protein